MKIIRKYWMFIAFFSSSTAIITALIAQYFFELLPCKMCIYQRYPYYIIIFISLIFFYFRNIHSKIYLYFTELCFLFGIFFSIWHVGIERKIFSGFSSCSSEINSVNSLKDLKNQIINQDVVFCDEITWSFFGVSIATINSFFLFVLLIFNTILILTIINDKEKKI